MQRGLVNDITSYHVLVYKEDGKIKGKTALSKDQKREITSWLVSFPIKRNFSTSNIYDNVVLLN